MTHDASAQTTTESQATAAPPSPPVGTIGWFDLTVDDAITVRDFYAAVVGWAHTPVNMSEYEDYCMMPEDAESPVAGICHRRGCNEALPSQWLMYITVANAETAATQAVQHGGEIVRPLTEMGPMGRYCVIRDPAGAVAALYQPAS